MSSGFSQVLYIFFINKNCEYIHINYKYSPFFIFESQKTLGAYWVKFSLKTELFHYRFWIIKEKYKRVFKILKLKSLSDKPTRFINSFLPIYNVWLSQEIAKVYTVFELHSEICNSFVKYLTICDAWQRKKEIHIDYLS